MPGAQGVLCNNGGSTVNVSWSVYNGRSPYTLDNIKNGRLEIIQAMIPTIRPTTAEVNQTLYVRRNVILLIWITQCMFFVKERDSLT